MKLDICRYLSLVKSGAKDLLASAVSLLLEKRPLVPIAFLADHFQAVVAVEDAVMAAIHLVQSVSCTKKPMQFQEAVHAAYRVLSALNESSTSSLKPSPSTSDVSTRHPKAKKPLTASQQHVAMPPQQQSPVQLLDRRDFLRFLDQLCNDLPSNVKERALAAVLAFANASQGIALPEFQRACQICVLVEELLDEAEMLFQSMDKQASGQIKVIQLVSAMENADTNNTIAQLLKEHLTRSTTTNGSPSKSNLSIDSTIVHQRTITLRDLVDMVMQLVFFD